MKTNPFKKFVRSKYRFAQMYANETSSFSDNSFRKKIFNIKSTLSGNYQKDDLLYIAINLPRRITKIFTDYVVGKGISVDFGDEKKNASFVELVDEIGFQMKLNKTIDNQSTIGHGLVRVRKKGRKVRMEVIPVTNYAANVSGLSIGDDFDDITEHYIFSVIKEESDTYFYVDRYRMGPEDKNGGREWFGYYGEKYKYNDSMIFDELIQPATSEERLPFLPLFIFNNDLVNQHMTTDDPLHSSLGNLPKYFHQSDYSDIADLVQELNDRESQISVEFIKNLTSKLSVPESFQGTRKASSLKKSSKDADVPKTIDQMDYLSHGHGEHPAHYVQKDIQHTALGVNNYIPMIIRFISAVSAVPASLLGLDAIVGNNPVGTIEKEFEGFYNRVMMKQMLIYSSLQRMCAAIMYFYSDGSETPDKLPTIKFARVETGDIQKKTDVAERQLAMGIMSKQSAIQYTRGLDEQEIQEEIEKINNETTEAYARNGSTLSLDTI